MTAEPFMTREQRYAREVFDRIKPLAARPESERKAYGSLAHKLPVLIRTSGLAQALAFVEARNGDNTPQRQLLKDLESVLRANGALAENARLTDRSRNADFEEYMRLTEASLQALLWFKRFAQSELKVEAGTEAE